MLIQLVAIVASTGGPVWKGGGKTVTVVVNEGLGSYTVNGAPGQRIVVSIPLFFSFSESPPPSLF